MSNRLRAPPPARAGREGACVNMNAITQRSVDPLPQIDHLVDETRCARFFTKMDLAMAYTQFRIRMEDQHKTSECPAVSTSFSWVPSTCMEIPWS